MKSKLKVFYGFAKLTKKLVRKHELVIVFENGYSYKNQEWIESKIHLVHTRFQTEKEMGGSEFNNRMFTKYGYLIDEKFKGNIDRVLENNFIADKNHVSLEERRLIKKKLLETYYHVYDVKKEYQTSLIFEG